MLRLLFPARARRAVSAVLPPAQGRYQPRRLDVAALNRNSLAGQQHHTARGVLGL